MSVCFVCLFRADAKRMLLKQITSTNDVESKIQLLWSREKRSEIRDKTEMSLESTKNNSQNARKFMKRETGMQGFEGTLERRRVNI